MRTASEGSAPRADRPVQVSVRLSRVLTPEPVDVATRRDGKCAPSPISGDKANLEGSVSSCLQ